MQHKCRVTVIDKKLYPQLQEQYCADPNSGACPCYNVGDEYIFERYADADDFWHMGINTLKKTAGDPSSTAGSAKLPHCSEAWDAISRYIYAALEGGSIMRSWMREENTMIACCSDGTRPVIFKIERLDYIAVYIDGVNCEKCRAAVKDALMQLDGVTDVCFTDKGFTEVFVSKAVHNDYLIKSIEAAGDYKVTRID